MGEGGGEVIDVTTCLNTALAYRVLVGEGGGIKSLNTPCKMDFHPDFSPSVKNCQVCVRRRRGLNYNPLSGNYKCVGGSRVQVWGEGGG